MSQIEVMKAITLWQPWASLIACGAKKFETRSWATRHRGLIAIHAGKQEWHLTLFQGRRDIQEAIIFAFGGTPNHERGSAVGGNFNLPRGAIIATAELVGCYKVMQADSGTPYVVKDGMRYFIGENEQLFGDWTPGRYAWELVNVQMLPEPISAKGKQGLWNWERVA